ncbi:transformer-2 protein homolog beta isoform X2 [Halyomorpha halys]|uniref:transformer-2 protein homolog beta isoform X2 n=1 Tax=Halyomorpha halys TaxID=286706 RepID=UPI0006D4D624|nr:transformer-2 protein homolog beta-like isoform X2 [Halyomorpha halys]
MWGHSPAGSLSDRSKNGNRKGIVMPYRSRSKERSRSRSPSTHKSKRKYSRSRSRSRSHHKYRSSKYRSRSRSPRRSYKRYSRSYSRSASYSPPHYRRGRRTHSRSPMSNRRRHTGSRDNPEPNRCLGVFGLSIYTTEQQIHHIFSKYGPVESVQVVMDAKTGHSRGFCFVYFENYEDARVAKEQCTGMEIDGKKIRVDFSITQRAHTPTPGIYMGKPTYSDRYRRDRDYGDYYGGGGGGGGYRGSRYRSPSPYYYSSRSRRRYDRYDRSRSRSYSPMGYGHY